MDAEYQDNDIIITSRDPLMGTLEFMGDDDEIIEVSLDRETAEALMSALVQFLAAGEGDDASSIVEVQ